MIKSEEDVSLCSIPPSFCSYHVLGHAGPALLQDFYTIEGLAEQMVSSALIHLEHVPDHRLRPLLHILYKISSH